MVVIDFVKYISSPYSPFLFVLVRVWTFAWSTRTASVTMVRVDITTLTPLLILWNIRGTSYLRSSSTASTGPRTLTRLVEIEYDKNLTSSSSSSVD